jgi:ubiquinol-cytochrome c reductase cytochrome b subunit
MSIAILLILPLTQTSGIRSNQFYPINQILFWCFLNIVILLTWIGARPVEDPYILVGQLLTVIYFLYYIINPLTLKCWDKALFL